MTAALPIAVGLLSGAGIAYQILLTRLFSIVLWHHFAFMIISIALLGIGASGTFLTVFRTRLERRFPLAFGAFAVLFAATAPLAFVLAQRVPFNPLEIVWDPSQQLYLLVIYTTLAVPFFAVGTCIGLALARPGAAIGLIYRADMAGAGLGAAGVVGLLTVLFPDDSLRMMSTAGLAAAGAVALAAERPRRAVAAGLCMAAVAGALIWPASWLAPQPSPFKGLSTALTRPEAHVLERQTSPLGVLTAVESPVIPFRQAPGLSLLSRHEPPPQLGIFSDAGSMTALNLVGATNAVTNSAADQGDGAPKAATERLSYLQDQPMAAAYHALRRPRVLVLGAGGGADVWRARLSSARHIDAVELDGKLIDLLRGRFREAGGAVYDRADVTVHVAEARSFVTRSDRHWDLIQLALVDAFSAAASGVQALNETTLYTEEALTTYLDHLTAGGILSMTRWLQTPPRETLKLINTATAALGRLGIDRPERHIALIASWNTGTLLVKRTPFTERETEALAAFARDKSFELVYRPYAVAERGLPNGDSSDYSLDDGDGVFLRVPGAPAQDLLETRAGSDTMPLAEAVGRLLGPHGAAFTSAYKFHIAAATDDQPYFFRFFKWTLLPELLALRGQGGLALLDSGYLILVMTLAQVIPLSILVIIIPLFALGQERRRLASNTTPEATSESGPRAPPWRVAAYFLFLGLAFLLLEIAFIQRFVLFLGHPLYAVAVVLAGILVFAGLGAGRAQRVHSANARRVVAVAAGVIVGLTTLYALVLPPLFAALTPWTDWARVLAALLLLAPLAFAMGLPFPLGLAEISRTAPQLVPWAWAVNGCASVISAVATVLLAVHFGFTAVLAIAGLLYIGAAAVFPVAKGRS